MYRGMERKIQKAVWTEWCEVEDVSIWWILFSLLSRRHLEVHGSLTLKPDLENFDHYFASV